jgi:hypothetical protein
MNNRYMDKEGIDWSSLSSRKYMLDYDSSVAMRYHAARRSFLEGLDRLDPALTVIFGSTAFAAIVTAHPVIAASAAALATTVSALNLAFGVGERARLHDTLFRRWADLKAELISLKKDDEPGLQQIEIKRARIDGDSPGQLLALTVLCDDDERRVRGAGGLSHVRGYQRFLANWITLPPWHFEETETS